MCNIDHIERFQQPQCYIGERSAILSFNIELCKGKVSYVVPDFTLVMWHRTCIIKHPGWRSMRRRHPNGTQQNKVWDALSFARTKPVIWLNTVLGKSRIVSCAYAIGIAWTWKFFKSVKVLSYLHYMQNIAFSIWSQGQYSTPLLRILVMSHFYPIGM